jgi:excisionase family DNA binding protein
MSKYHTTDETAEYLRMSKSTLYNYVYMRKIPFHKIGARVVFIFDELDKWIDEQTQATIDMRPEEVYAQEMME